MHLLEIESELAKQRQLSCMSIEVQETLGSNELKVINRGKLRDLVAETVGLSPTRDYPAFSKYQRSQIYQRDV